MTGSRRVHRALSEPSLRRLAALLGARARGGELVCLEGLLGAGKTTFAKGFARGAGFRGEVTSPTFALVNVYPLSGRRLTRVHHMDLYRVKAGELANIGFAEYLADERAACLIEWPDAARALLPKDRLEVALAHAAEGRDARLRATGPLSRRLLGA